MHSKQTVKYICKTYPSGNQYFYKSELITHDSWNNIQSLSWSTPRPISKSTFQKREKEGYKIEENFINQRPAQVLAFPKILNKS
ncbi:hypothetical protein AB3N04_03125 [Alkalihalophilus sp. As8PL]|uniref:Uncharacterized protein n=1 Tax=Alkalihalophilus sp. As8PL TaxID=3237103 RepID=A0AB39BUB6_9BACI